MFSQTVEYALRAMMFLTSREVTPASSERIAATTKVPAGYLSKVMRDLVVAELVVSQRGPNGGFALARAATEISILDVVNAVDPMRRIKECPLGNPAHLSMCPLHKRLDAAMAQVEEGLGATSLAEILSSGVAPGQCGATAVELTGVRSERPAP